MHNFLKEAFKSDLRDGLVQLQSILKEESPYQNELIMLQSRERKATTKMRKRIITDGDYEIETGRILDAALEIIDELKASDFMFTSLKKVNILVICRNDTDLQYMKHKLDRFHLKGTGKVDIEIHQTFNEETAAKKYDLVIFDNRSLQPVPDGHLMTYPAAHDKERLKLMKTWLNHSPSLVLHFGPTWSEMDHYRDQIHAANSIFALHARMKEMIHYIIDIQMTDTEKKS
ncbi:MAG: hypothetical protein KDD63_11430 [Bacteroidetes bacterium]|nr:hypothetical protein [Bacteroidota bacterium]MCB0844669.1 hypothetical protein [Bacteroidota bacterium]MCB0852830.1 hypothetical protein [Bacteroidota bacterium]